MKTISKQKRIEICKKALFDINKCLKVHKDNIANKELIDDISKIYAEMLDEFINIKFGNGNNL